MPSWGTLIRLLVQVVLMKIRHNIDTFKLREVTKIRKATNDQINEIEKAVADGDSIAISVLWKQLH